MFLLALVGCDFEPPAERGSDPTREIVDLRGTWDGHPGDAPTEAGWLPTTMPPNDIDAAGSSGKHYWYRRTVELPPGRGRAAPPMALGLSFGGAAYEAYADGILIGGRGVLVGPRAGANYDMRGRVLDIPADVLADDVVEIRLRTVDMTGRVELPFHGIYGRPFIGPASVIRAETRAIELRYSLEHRVSLFVLCLLVGVLGVWHGGIYLRRPEQYSYKWYAVLLFTFAAILALLSLYRAPFTTPFDRALVLRVTTAVSGLSLYAAVMFFQTLLHGKSRSWRTLRWTATALVALGTLQIVTPVLENVIWAPVLVVISWVGGLVILEALRGHRAARIVSVGVLIVLLNMSLEALVNLGLIDRTGVPEVVIIGPLVIIVSMAVALADQFARSLDDLDASHTASLRFVPKKFLQLLNHSRLPEVRRGDVVKRDVTVMFSDIRGFTALSERLSAEATFALVNDYLAVMQPEIERHGGFVGSYLGDGIMAIFPEETDAAIDACIAQVEALRRFNTGRETPLAIGIGLHRGPLMLGTVGATGRLQCTIVGDVVNLSARIEGMTKIYGASILVSQDCVDTASKPSRFRELDRVSAKGRESPIAIYEVLDADPVPMQEKKRTAEVFKGALVAYRSGDMDRAAAGFEVVTEANPEDHAAQLYVQRCRQLAAEGVPDNWDGTWRMTTK